MQNSLRRGLHAVVSLQVGYYWNSHRSGSDPSERPDIQNFAIERTCKIVNAITEAHLGEFVIAHEEVFELFYLVFTRRRLTRGRHLLATWKLNGIRGPRSDSRSFRTVPSREIRVNCLWFDRARSVDVDGLFVESNPAGWRLIRFLIGGTVRTRSSKPFLHLRVDILKNYKENSGIFRREFLFSRAIDHTEKIDVLLGWG